MRMNLQPGGLNRADAIELVPPRGRDDSLIAALMEKLPAPGTPWPAVERQAWLDMMAIAFITLYGAAGVAKPNSSVSPKAPARLKRSASRRPAPPKPLKGPGPAFYIDREGFARRTGGDRIMPGQIAGMLVDQRGEHGDLGAIVWADGSRGIPKGLQLDIGIGETLE